MAIKIKEEVKKHIDADFLVTSEYPHWLANIVPVPKKDGKRVRKYKLRLNPNKYTFGVRSRKLLGFIVSQKGIEVDPDKVKAIQEMPAPQTEKQMLLSEYDIEYHTLKVIIGSVLADHLAHQSIDDYESIKFEFPNQDVMYLKAKDCNEPLLNEGLEPGSQRGLIFDGVVNAYGNGIEAVIITPHDSHIPFTARLTCKCTNNMAEYKACIMGLEEAIDLRIKNLDVYGDSTLVVNQIKGEWETRQLGIIPYKDYARRLSTFFNKIEFHRITREENQMADVLVTLASMIIVNRWNDVPKIDVMHIDRPAHVFAMEEVSDDKPWYHDIKCHL
ncbi:uncharacterized protein LOC127136130 [Lathyrus oleraceus]|uniref:uncharacterized protein LOC127136130 n=1 Tax=Pisum sativum TaxID=3888 RepID=UPI0021CF04A4|nr:uncharacterized protein LOC127136130 [Pisum sativum]